MMTSALRPILFVLGTAAALVACGKDGGGGTTDPTPDAADVIDPPVDGFQLKTPDITIGAGIEDTYCWYFKAPNTKTLAIKKWVSHMTPGSHHLIMYVTSAANPNHAPGGAPVRGGCDQGSGISNLPVWTYSSQMADQEMALPTDDGAGKPVGMEIAAGQFGHLEVHYNNRTDLDIVANVTVNAEAYPDGTTYTPTAAFVTYNASISIPDGSVDLAISQTCPVHAAASKKFWTLSTHSHKQTTKTEVKDGSIAGVMKFESSDWEHPGFATWNPTFDGFASGSLTYTCSYTNMTGREITSGNSAVTDEMCMAVGYFFPATKPTICINNFIVTE